MSGPQISRISHLGDPDISKDARSLAKEKEKKEQKGNETKEEGHRKHSLMKGGIAQETRTSPSQHPPISKKQISSYII